MRLIIFILIIVLLPIAAASSFPIGDWDLYPYPLFWGVGLGAVYRGFHPVDGVDTAIYMGSDISYDGTGYYRYPDDSLYDPPGGGVFKEGGDAAYDRLKFRWSLGVNQGLIYSDTEEQNLLHVFLLYRGIYHSNFDNNSLLFRSDLEDVDGIFQNSFVSGLSLNTVRRNENHNTRHGLLAETSIEAAPGFLANRIFGAADFFRYNLQLKFYLTLFDLDSGSTQNILNLIFSGRSVFDYLFGGTIPLNARQSLGGSGTITAMGGAVRGVQNGRFDGFLKFVQNLDLRLNLPGFFGITPALNYYFDIGFYDDLTRGIEFVPERFLFSTGVGLLLNLRFFDIGLSANYFFAESLFTLNLEFGFVVHY